MSIGELGGTYGVGSEIEAATAKAGKVGIMPRGSGPAPDGWPEVATGLGPKSGSRRGVATLSPGEACRAPAIYCRGRDNITLGTGCGFPKGFFDVWLCVCVAGRLYLDRSISIYKSQYKRITLMSKAPNYDIVGNCMNEPIPPIVPLDQNPETAKRHSAWRELFSTLGILLTALLVALFIIGFVFRSYQVDGPSMQNTLQNADKLIIWKVPRTWASITGHAYIPDRGDIIVFSESGLSEFNQQDSKQLIKRVIGLPGDRLVLSNGAYTIYNKAHPHGFNPDRTLPYGKNIPTTTGNVDLTLGKDQLFVSGDNRPDSLDSRAFGPINANQIIGKLVLRVFPVNQSKVF